MRTLRLTCWNVNGLYRRTSNYCKTEDNEFTDSVYGYDIIGLVETHAGPEDDISVKDYYTYQVYRPKSDKAYKYSGGIAALIRSDIKAVIRLAYSDVFAIWLKLDKYFFGLEEDLYVAITYLPPDNSSYTKNCHYLAPIGGGRGIVMPMSVCLCVCPCFRKISKCNISAISQPITMKFGTHTGGGRGLPSLIALFRLC